MRSDSFSFGMLALLAPDFARRVVESEEAGRRAVYERHKGEAVTWDEDRTRFAKRLIVDGASYRPYQLFDVATIEGTTLVTVPKAEAKRATAPCGRFHYVQQRLPAGVGIELAQGNRRGWVWFTTDVVIPVLVEGVPGGKSETWMSLTPMEVLTQRRGVQRATGTVLIGGLGLGWLVRRVCAKPSVKRVIVVEREQSLLDWIGPRLRGLFPEVAAKVTDWIAGDVYDHLGKHGDETRHLLDIWKSYGGCDGKFDRAKKTVRHLWGWGDVA